MNLVNSLVGILVALGILVTIHEFGHFWVARRNGIKVLRFSIGFGRPLIRWHDRHGTEFAIAWIPLGGYVKMLDEREGPVAASERDQAFNNKTPLQRIAVASAGVIANFLFAILAFAALYSVGVRELASYVEAPLDSTPAALAGFAEGDRITALDGQSINSWRGISLALASRVGDSGELEFQVERNGTERELSIPVQRWLASESEPNPLSNLGLFPDRPDTPAIIGEVFAGGAAAAAGLQAGDRIVAVDGQAIENWLDWVAVIQPNGGLDLTVDLIRNGAPLQLTVTPIERDVNGQVQGFIGAAAAPVEWPADRLMTFRVAPWTGIWLGLQDTWEMVHLSFKMLGKMLSGLVSVQQIGGPISMAQLAGDSVQGGLESFVRFLAFISISLGVVNLLPIPILDGGHILFYSIEWLRGRPLSERVQAIGSQLGLLLVMGLMVLAFVNDLGRLG
ncbi:RIP metalloprotease RseP [Saccharospirillum mangrovi]|uniref:RIP metalloprotease RseP n=1 Tax=Saccharospirillum mangrovi TaxID=2161747 RepID=UPI000D38CF8D|nr:RIP metalloprotease RseP [Saccharospirillum mangrovi]